MLRAWSPRSAERTGSAGVRFTRTRKPRSRSTPTKRLWNCFSCEAGGDALVFLQRKENLEFLPALQRLRELAGTTTSEPPPSQNTPAYQRNDLLERVIEHYQDCFRRTPTAQQYRNQRGLDSRCAHPFHSRQRPVGLDQNWLRAIRTSRQTP